jgi:hypothetical protein
VTDDADEDDDWPRELRFLLERHPRAIWPLAGSPTVSFWLEVHDRLRRNCAGLETTSDDYMSRRATAAQLAVIAAPRLRGLLAAARGHHEIEDTLYFPALRRQEARLTAGFDRLEREHAELALSADTALVALADLRAAADVAEARAAPLAAQRYVAASRGLCDRLRRHLKAEEELVVPVLLEYVEH